MSYNEMERVTLKHDSALSLEEVKTAFNLAAGEINEEAGVVPLCHAEDTVQIYAVEVTSDAAARMEKSGNALFGSRLGNPRTTSFDPYTP